MLQQSFNNPLAVYVQTYLIRITRLFPPPFVKLQANTVTSDRSLRAKTKPNPNGRKIETY